METTSAQVTIFVDVYDEQAMWDAAYEAYVKTGTATSDAEVIRKDFEELCGPRDEPDIAECLRMIFDPGESPPGLQINDSSAEIDVPF